MDRLLKVLVAAACVVIIAGGGYFAWREYTLSTELAERQARAAAVARKQALEEQAAKQAPCKQALNDLRAYDVFEKPNVQWSAEFLAIRVRECLDDGLLTQADAEKVKHRL